MSAFVGPTHDTGVFLVGRNNFFARSSCDNADKSSTCTQWVTLLEHTASPPLEGEHPRGVVQLKDSSWPALLWEALRCFEIIAAAYHFEETLAAGWRTIITQPLLKFESPSGANNNALGFGSTRPFLTRLTVFFSQLLYVDWVQWGREGDPVAWGQWQGWWHSRVHWLLWWPHYFGAPLPPLTFTKKVQSCSVDGPGVVTIFVQPHYYIWECSVGCGSALAIRYMDSVYYVMTVLEWCMPAEHALLLFKEALQDSRALVSWLSSSSSTSSVCSGSWRGVGCNPTRDAVVALWAPSLSPPLIPFCTSLDRSPAQCELVYSLPDDIKVYVRYSGNFQSLWHFCSNFEVVGCKRNLNI